MMNWRELIYSRLAITTLKSAAIPQGMTSFAAGRPPERVARGITSLDEVQGLPGEPLSYKGHHRQRRSHSPAWWKRIAIESRPALCSAARDLICFKSAARVGLVAPPGRPATQAPWGSSARDSSSSPFQSCRDDKGRGPHPSMPGYIASTVNNKYLAGRSSSRR